DTPDVGAFETSALQSTSNGSLTLSTGGIGRVQAKSLGSIGVLTDPVTNQKSYTVSNSAGRFYFTNVPRLAVIEVKSKRQGFSCGLMVFSFDDLVFVTINGQPQPVSLGQGITATVELTPAKK